ncbi:MAG: DUF1579 domain-containing protein, partial [Actinomycetota bacterium]|nr:DUF1579 domain-containing protein [Actinomycetota bacterium]
ERSARRSAALGPEQRKLDVFIGKWINEGYTVARPEVPSAKILTSDIYEWAPGGFFILHTAYGRIGEHDVGGIEIISYEPQAGSYLSRFYDSQGNVNASQLTELDGAWTWSDKRARCTATFSQDSKTQTAHHESSEDGTTWIPSMDVTLRKIA